MCWLEVKGQTSIVATNLCFVNEAGRESPFFSKSIVATNLDGL
jgi:hypothetical protein